MPKVSVIIPVYNSERYLRQCLDSVLYQSYLDWECILINDGSKDTSGQICNEYTQKDNRFVVIHQENCGVSSARNVGLSRAKGEYITFLDSDDMMSVDNLNEMLCSKEVFDIVIVGSSLKRQETKILYFQTNSLSIRGKKSIVEYFFCKFNHKKQYHFYCYGKLFKTEIIQKNKIKFNPTITLGEDRMFILEYLQYCNSMRIQISANPNVYISSLSANLSCKRRDLNQLYDIFTTNYIQLKHFYKTYNIQEIKQYADNYFLSNVLIYMVFAHSDRILKINYTNKFLQEKIKSFIYQNEIDTNNVVDHTYKSMTKKLTSHTKILLIEIYIINKIKTFIRTLHIQKLFGR